MEPFQLVFTFFLGLLSFTTPCVLPIVPSYLSYMFGAEKRDLMRGAAAIYLGVSLGGLLIGTTLAAMGSVGASRWFYLASAILMALLIVDFVATHKIRQITFGGILNRRRGNLAGFVFGLLIIFIASPCVIPLLAAASLLALSVEEALSRVALILCYSAGLGLPFIVISAFSNLSPKINSAAQNRTVKGMQLVVLFATLFWLVSSFFTA